MGNNNHKAIAFVLIEVPATRSGGVTEASRGIQGVVEAWAVFGTYDVIAKIEARNLSELEDIVMNKIQRLPQVKTTRTLITLSTV